ncbi:MAG: PhzF family phenazine biosynthesis protein [Deltaproteobacteria bacterium]|nr:PhzF family phenazine biosynthesis protein [Deltaproteobacteria bacterium]
MQAIAKEMNQSEAAFLVASEVADPRARYFTPKKEISPAGHPTLLQCTRERPGDRRIPRRAGTRFVP